MRKLDTRATIHFGSGKTRTIGVTKFNNFPVELNKRGIKTMRDDSDEGEILIPLNSNTMEFIECLYVDVAEPVVEPEPEIDLNAMKAEIEESVKEVESKEDIEEKRKNLEEEMFAKSNCTHENMEIYRHDTSKGSRYFPVCAFCGKRERYVKADSLSDEVKANAKVWID